MKSSLWKCVSMVIASDLDVRHVDSGEASELESHRVPAEAPLQATSTRKTPYL